MSCFLSEVNIKVTGISIGTICQDPQLYSPFCRLILYVFPNSRSVFGFYHTLIHSNFLKWLAEVLASLFEVVQEATDFLSLSLSSSVAGSTMCNVAIRARAIKPVALLFLFFFFGHLVAVVLEHHCPHYCTCATLEL